MYGMSWVFDMFDKETANNQMKMEADQAKADLVKAELASQKTKKLPVEYNSTKGRKPKTLTDVENELRASLAAERKKKK